MKTIWAGAAMLTAFCGSEALAQGTVRAVTAGETVLHIVAEGRARTRADEITIVVSVGASGDTAEAARAATVAKVDALTKALVAVGIDSGSITVSSLRQPFGFVGNEAITEEGVTSITAMTAPRGKRSASSMVQIKLSDPARIKSVTAVLDGRDEAMSLPPALALKDDGAARRTAATDALSRARAEADTYASALGLRVAGIAQVSNFAAVNAGEEPNYVQMMMAMQVGDPGNDVVTRVRVTVDFILTSR